MTREETEIAVVGGGLVGASIAWGLARVGKRVTPRLRLTESTEGNGKKMLDKVAATWGANPEDALPNLYIGGTGTSYHEPWQGDLAEIIVYARMLSDQERMQVEDYLAKKYGVALAR